MSKNDQVSKIEAYLLVNTLIKIKDYLNDMRFSWNVGEMQKIEKIYWAMPEKVPHNGVSPFSRRQDFSTKSGSCYFYTLMIPNFIQKRLIKIVSSIHASGWPHKSKFNFSGFFRGISGVSLGFSRVLFRQFYSKFSM